MSSNQYSSSKGDILVDEHSSIRISLRWDSQDGDSRHPASEKREGDGYEFYLAIGDEEFLGPCDALPGVVEADGGRDDENEDGDDIVDCR